MTAHRTILAFAAACLFSACASSGPLPDPDPANIPALESQLAADPGDIDSALRLAGSYRAASRIEDARALLEGPALDGSDDPGVIVLLGLLDEDAGDFGSAQRRYAGLVQTLPGGDLRDEVERRLERVRIQALRDEARATLDRESELAQTAPDPTTISVFPFSYDGSDPQWAPLGVALAELLTTDLAITGRLTVLERVQVQALLDEMALGASGRVTEETAARSGRMLGSGHVVQGQYRVESNARVGVDAAVVEVGLPGTERVDPLSSEDAIDRIFDLEKQLALDIHDELGISLTSGERARIDERQTANVQALLAFGRGLSATDAGEFAQAEAFFAEATSLDPGFVLAQGRRQSAARAAGAGVGQATQRLSAQASRLARQRAAVAAIRNAPASVRQRMLQNLGQRKRAVLAEVLGQDRLGTAILLELVFRRPGGQP